MAEATLSSTEATLENQRVGGLQFVMSILRFFTGLGIGGAFPGAATLTGDYAPQRRRALMIMASFTGAPVGGFICGQLAGVLLPAFSKGFAITLPLFTHSDG